MLMRNKIYLLMLLAASAVLPAQAQQEVQFSQYVFNGLTVNPAYAGYRGDGYLNATFRKQWVDFPGAPTTGVISFDGLPGWADSEKVGLGIQALWDKSGPQEYMSVAGSYAYRIPLNESGSRRLNLGFNVSVAQYSVTGNSLQLTNPNDPYAPTGKISTFKPDASFGVYYYTPSFYAGASVLQLFSQTLDNTVYVAGHARDYMVIKRTRHVYFTTGGMINIDEHLRLKPSIMIKEDFNGPTNVDLNLFALISDQIWIGGSYRSSVPLLNKEKLQDGLRRANAASAMVEYFASDRIRIGYSYDFAISGIANYQSGSHEISIGLLFPRKQNGDRIISPRYF